jgi:prepilin-type N-terminal cleavage/methylation domain-containing protein
MPISAAGRVNNKSPFARGATGPVAPRVFREQALGMTLIELMVSMVVVGIILSIAVVGIRNFTDTEMKEASNHLASTIRYLYNKSVTERLYLRIVYDFDEHSYHVEERSDPFVISPPDPEEEEKEDTEEDTDDEEAEEEQNDGFSEAESYLLESVKLGGDIYFKDVQVSYSKDKIEDEQAYTYFFPNGFATPTIINLRDEDDETNYSLEVMPLSGRVRIESRYRELAKEEEE